MSSTLLPDTRGLYGRTALHLAARAGRREAARALAEEGATLDARTEAGFTALHLACWNGHLEVPGARHGCGSKLNHQGTAGFSHGFHLPGFHFGYPFFDPQPHELPFG